MPQGIKVGDSPWHQVGILIIEKGTLRCLWVMLCVCFHDKCATPLGLLQPKGFGYPHIFYYEKQWSVATQTHTWFKGNLLCNDDGYQLGLNEFAIPLTTKTTHELIQSPSIYTSMQNLHEAHCDSLGLFFMWLRFMNCRAFMRRRPNSSSPCVLGAHSWL